MPCELMIFVHSYKLLLLRVGIEGQRMVDEECDEFDGVAAAAARGRHACIDDSLMPFSRGWLMMCMWNVIMYWMGKERKEGGGGLKMDGDFDL